MIAAMAVAAGAAFAEPITSANIVGFGQVTDQECKNTGVGGIFFPIGLEGTYDLSMLQVAGAEEGDYMDPGTEFVKVLNPDTTVVDAKYTFVSLDFLKDNVEGWEDHEDAIGWWNYDKTVDYAELIGEGDYSLKIKGEVPVTMGTAFLGSFDGNGLRFISNGEVPQVVTEFRDDGNKNPFFLNYLPTEIDINDIVVAGDDEEADYMDPGTEFVKVLNPDTTVVDAKYTYVSLAFLKDNVEGWEEHLDAIGWWNYDKTVDYAELIGESDYELKIKGELAIAPGFSFLGSFDGNDLRIKFPSATDVPSKK